MTFSQRHSRRPTRACSWAICWIVAFLLEIVIITPLRAATFAHSISWGSPVTVMASHPLPLTVDFGIGFHNIERIQVNLQFAGDLWDEGETWFINVFGGQSNLSGPSRSSAGLQSEDPTSMVFRDGREDFQFSMESGAVGLSSLEWVIEGDSALRGDFNNDATVDATDYVVWRNTSGQAGAGLAADGNGDGFVNAADYDLWRAHYGQTAVSGSRAGAIATIPEPATMLLLMFAGAGWCLQRGWIG